MILDDIVNKTKERLEERKKQISQEDMKEMALAMNVKTDFPFEKALQKEKMNFICEIKKASPSKGIIAHEFPYMQIACEYEQAGAAALSVLTEQDFFMGKNQYLEEIADAVSIPVLRKDFTIDPYMIYEAKVLGASAVLLIAAVLTPNELKTYLELAHSLGMSALVEAHDETEIKMALQAGARILGVNNRNLKTFKVDIQNSIRLRTLVPQNTIFVSESGMKTPEDIAVLKQNDIHAVLIGEAMMRCPDKKAELLRLRG